VPVYGAVRPTITLNSHRPPGHGLSMRHNESSPAPEKPAMLSSVASLDWNYLVGDTGSARRRRRVDD
jgi:hypothetical protein